MKFNNFKNIFFNKSKTDIEEKIVKENIIEKIKNDINLKKYDFDTTIYNLDKIDINLRTNYINKEDGFLEYLIFCLDSVNLEGNILDNNFNALSRINNNIDNVLSVIFKDFNFLKEDSGNFILKSINYEKKSDKASFSTIFFNEKDNAYIEIERKQNNPLKTIDNYKFTDEINIKYKNDEFKLYIELNKHSQRYNVCTSFKNKLIKSIELRFEENNNKSYALEFHEIFNSNIKNHINTTGLIYINSLSKEFSYVDLDNIYEDISNVLKDDSVLKLSNLDKQKDNMIKFMKIYKNNLNIESELITEAIDILSLNDIKIINNNRYSNLNEKTIEIVKKIDHIIHKMIDDYTETYKIIKKINNK